MSRHILAVCAFLLFSSLASAQQQTDEQKRLMDRQKQNFLKNGKVNSESLHYLLKRKRGIPAVEDAISSQAASIIDAITEQKDPVKKYVTSYPWIELLDAYEHYVSVEDVPDKMIPAFVYRFEVFKPARIGGKGASRRDLIDQAVEFGPRGKGFLPTLEKMRDGSTDELFIRRVTDAINSIKSAPLPDQD